LYCRHVKGLKLHNVQLQTAAPELRHALVCDDVEDLVVDGLDAGFSPKAAATIRLIQTRGALIRGCRPPAGTDAFLCLEGAATRRIVLTGSDFGSAGKVVEPAAEVPGDGYSVIGCLPRTE
jgi:hypothetical protein